jgi:uncharacterized protein YjiK
MSTLRLRGLLALAVLVNAAGCREGPVDRGRASAAGIAHYDLAAPPSAQLRLPAELREISGLAVHADGRVFAHGDEEGTVYQLDPSSGQVTKRFALAARGDEPDLGKKSRADGVAGDFEDIAIVGDRFFLVSSNGVLLEFGDGADGAAVPYQSHPTGLEQVCEVEGLTHDPSTESLLLLCKTMREKSERQQVTIYSWSLADRLREETPRLSVPWSALARVTGADGFNGSALALVPGGRSLLMVAGPQQLFAEIASDGAPLLGGSMDKGLHPQPEGLAFLPDGGLLVASEGGKGEAVLARYSPGQRGES